MKELDLRLARIESRLVQLMLHMGLDPYKKQYDAEAPRRPAITRRPAFRKGVV